MLKKIHFNHLEVASQRDHVKKSDIGGNLQGVPS